MHRSNRTANSKRSPRLAPQLKADFPLRPNTVSAVAAQGGRIRCNIENQGFNLQKNSGLNLEHAYSTEPDILKAFCYLLPIAHLFLQGVAEK